MFRKLLTFPFNLICGILALIGIFLIRSKEIAIGIERKIDIFEENKSNKAKRNRKNK